MSAPEPGRGALIGALVVFVVGLALRLAVLVQVEAHYPLADRPVIDEASYETWALEIAGGDWIGDEVFFQEPLYPYWIASVYTVLGPERHGLRVVQALSGALVAAGVFGLTRRLFGPAAGWLAGLGFAVHRAGLFMPALLLKPNLFLPLLLGLAALLALGLAPPPVERRSALRRSLGLGCLAGLGALLRGNMVLLLPILVAWPAAAVWRRDGARRALALAAATAVGVLAILGPVATRNWVVGGDLALTTSGAGTNLYGGNNAQNPYGRATEFDWVRGIPQFEAADWAHEAERRVGHELAPSEVSSFWLGETLRSIAADPSLHARILWNKLRLTLGAYEVPDNHSLDWAATYVPLLSPLVPGYALWGSLGLAGLLLFVLERGRGARRGGGAALAILYLLYLGTIVATVTSMRARLPLVPLLLPFAGYLVTRFLAADRDPKRLLAAVAIGAAATLIPVFDAHELQQDLDKREFNLAVYSVEAGELERAESIATGLARRYPGTSRVETLLAELESRRAFASLEDPEGDRAQAQSLLQKALGRLRLVVEHPQTNQRERFRANALAAWIQLQLGNGPAAARRFSDALEFDPADEALRFGFANALHLEGHVDEALEQLRLLEPTPQVLARIAELTGQ
ncbi:glycosyltransferase family 39 protein [Engelhardtia mirabilis]|uniref:Undecaprenyl phosphate-alpha-4-amino-4-deoxy-L-arabinose arabinosyl transferase n=1 Tax=Engelhardtia mirabilis TaxID=2528011 RepID=A0A518BPR5_9BACT|nr:Undecaprenyl phosphate-alpha-4-amino-4-deoxy-L-arabinose arabinosyl transferase [Planctomycetes bacterium Pla133]QDV03282.1 Undecaprenyl phosphate-alpha-4-amino-4-deoxy-L-arabinose arabinosyl transferase [Planctomycetes bacterium Pla86]